MSSTTENLWPQDVVSQTFQTPQQILAIQAEALANRMNGVVIAEVRQVDVQDEEKSESRTVLRFEVMTADKKLRIKLFEVMHRRGFAYPVVINEPTELPTYLRRKYYAPSVGEFLSSTASMAKIISKPGSWVENENVCSTPKEFKEKLAKVLASMEVKSAVMSVLATAQQDLTVSDDR